jgi:hypothetical protein
MFISKKELAAWEEKIIVEAGRQIAEVETIHEEMAVIEDEKLADARQTIHHQVRVIKALEERAILKENLNNKSLEAFPEQLAVWRNKFTNAIQSRDRQTVRVNKAELDLATLRLRLREANDRIEEREGHWQAWDDEQTATIGQLKSRIGGLKSGALRSGKANKKRLVEQAARIAENAATIAKLEERLYRVTWEKKELAEKANRKIDAYKRETEKIYVDADEFAKGYRVIINSLQEKIDELTPEVELPTCDVPGMEAAR